MIFYSLFATIAAVKSVIGWTPFLEKKTTTLLRSFTKK